MYAWCGATSVQRAHSDFEGRWGDRIIVSEIKRRTEVYVTLTYV